VISALSDVLHPYHLHMFATQAPTLSPSKGLVDQLSLREWSFSPRSHPAATAFIDEIPQRYRSATVEDPVAPEGAIFSLSIV
jgi:hypothetical protein